MLEVQDQQERPETCKYCSINDYNTKPPTVFLNLDPIVHHKYSDFHHDDEDVQENSTNFIKKDDNLNPYLLCVGDGSSDECNRNDQ